MSRISKNLESISDQLITAIDDYKYETYSVAIAHSRDDESCLLAQAIKEDWETKTNWVRHEGGFVLSVVDYPEEAASWLRQAQKLAGTNPDIYVLIGYGNGLEKLLNRLSQEANFRKEDTFVLYKENEIFQLKQL